MKKRVAIVCGILIFLTSLSLLFSIIGKEPKQPNIIFIMSDDHSYQTISSYDDRYVLTPNIDRIANEGVIFKNSFVSNSICSPSRAVMLTGKHSHINGQFNNQMVFDGSQQTFPKLLQKAGYQTAIIGKWHLKSEPIGFDYWNILPGQGEYYNPDFIEMGEINRHEGYITDVTTDFAIKWLDKKRDKDKPFCLLVHNKAPHRTWMPDTTHLEFFKDTTFALPDNFFDDYEGRIAAQQQRLSIHKPDMDLIYDLKMADKEEEITSPRPQLVKLFYSKLQRMNSKQRSAWDKHYEPIINDFKKNQPDGKELCIWKFQRYMRDYLQCIKSVDDNVGRLLNYLDDNKLVDNTMVVYTSDQGFFMGEHGWFDMRFMYEQSFRTPLLMRYPNGFKKKGIVNEMVQNIDYAPTFLDFAGVDIPCEIQGVSLKPLLVETEDIQWRDALYYHYYEYPDAHNVKRHYGIRTERYKLIHFYKDIDVWELYDLKNDPDEMKNIYDDPANKELIENLKTRLVALQIEYKDTDSSTY